MPSFGLVHGFCLLRDERWGPSVGVLCASSDSRCFTASMATIRPPRGPHQLRSTALHVTGADIFGQTISEDEVIGALAGVSVYDCLRLTSRLSIMLNQGNRYSIELQGRMITDIIEPFSNSLTIKLRKLLTGGQVPFFEQQLYHLGRLAVLHADLRDGDDFGAGAKVGDFMTCLFGITDSFNDLEDPRDDGAVLSWALKQAAMNHNEERLTLWSFYFELFERIWPALSGAPDPEDAFRRYTGLGISEFLAVGFAMNAGFGNVPEGQAPQAEFYPEQWFKSSTVTEDAWRCFLKAAARPTEELRAALQAEVTAVGPSHYLSLEIEKTPIVIGADERVHLINMGALERRATQGIFHILSEGAEQEGKDRELYTAPFGAAFQQWAEACIRRMEEAGAEEPAIFADVPYGTKASRRDTPDAVVRYERQMICAEMVAGALRIQTLTHGDLDAFEKDLEKLILKKARQLDKRIAEIDAGEASSIGLNTDGIGRIWPVIVTAVSFPLWPKIMEEIRHRLKAEGILQGKKIGPISIVSAEELAALEGEVIAEGSTMLMLVSEWKSHAKTGDHALKNFLVERALKRGRPHAAAEHHGEMFKQASESMFAELFGTAPADRED
jgi:hypothetical protein